MKEVFKVILIALVFNGILGVIMDMYAFSNNANSGGLLSEIANTLYNEKFKDYGRYIKQDTSAWDTIKMVTQGFWNLAKFTFTFLWIVGKAIVVLPTNLIVDSATTLERVVGFIVILTSGVINGLLIFIIYKIVKGAV